MVGISSLADSFTGEEAAASGIGRYFRSGRRLGNSCRFDRDRFGSGSFDSSGFGGGIFCRIEPFGRRGIENAVGQRPKRGLKGREDLLAGAGAAATFEGINFGFDLRAEFVRSAPELAEETRDLASDLRHFLGAEKDQRHKKQEDHLA